MNKGYKPVKSYKQDGEIIALEFAVPTQNIGSFLRTGIFKFD